MDKSSVLLIEADKTHSLYDRLIQETGYNPSDIVRIDSPNTQVGAIQPLVIITDLHFQDIEPTSLVPLLNRLYPGVPVVVVTDMADEAQALQAIGFGAQDYLLRDSLQDGDMLKAIQCARVRNRTVSDYKRMFDESPGAMYIYDIHSFRFLDANTAALKQYGYTRDEFLAMKATEIRPAEELERYYEIQRTLKGNLYFDIGKIKHKDKSGRVFYVHIYSHYTIFEGHDARVVMAVDIDARVKVEETNERLHEKIRKQNQRLDAILSGITEAVWSCHADDLRITYINNASEYIFGYKPDELLGKSHTLLNSIHPDDRLAVDKEIELLPAKKKATLAFRLYDKKGELKYILSDVAMNKDEYGRDMITGISIDTTENHNYQKRIEEQLYRLREIADIQSHAIRGPVATIMGLAQLLRPERMDKDNAEIVRNMLAATSQLDKAIKEITDRTDLFQ